jgi:alkanesulfonate monooxygenase SsuD/methylene tetrahydromethanopterin reductase-like flavin-dependent oxidoreductase (luciferase family)
MLRITARHASEWNTWQAPDLADRCRGLREACEKTGRDPATVWTSVNALIDLDGSGPPSGRTLAGSPQQLIDQLGQFTGLGFDEFILPDWNLGATLGERADRLARLKTEVFDQLPD